MVSVEWLESPSELALVPVARLLSDFWREIIPSEPDVRSAELAAEIDEAPPHRRVLVATATEGSQLVGAAQLVLDDVRGHSSHGWVKYLVVRPDRRRRGVGAALLETTRRRARDEGRGRLESFVALSHVGGMGFASGIGATAGLVDRQSRLATKDLDRGLLEDWVTQAAQRGRDYSLVCFDGVCPDQWLAPFTQVLSVMNTAPRAVGVDDVVMTDQQVRANEEAHLRRGGWGWTVCVCHDPSGRWVGCTELGGSCHRPWLANQGDTGVESAHRNRGIGRWIKAINALRLLEERPDVRVVETWNAGVNASMLAINDAMGFRPVAEWQEWRLDVRSS